MSADAPQPNKPAVPTRANIDTASIRLDNWGEHLLKKLHDSYRREDNCDLEMVLQHDKSVRVHGSIMHVCTEYFKIQMESQGTPGRVVLPETVGTAPLLAIVQFLYTGELAINASTLDSICCTAAILGLDEITNAIRSRKSAGFPSAAHLNAAGVTDMLPAPVAAQASRGISGAKSGTFFAGKKRSALPPDSLVKLEVKRRRAVVGTDATPTDNEEAKHDVGKGPLKKLYNKVTKLTRHPNLARSIRRNEETVKQLTSSDVFKKYNGDGSNASFFQGESSSAKMIMDLIKKNPKLLRDDHPTKLKIKQMSASGQERIMIVSVSTKIDLQGKRSIQIIQSPEYDAELIRVDGPWSCTRCLRAGGKILEFSSYQECRTHMTKVHSVTFDPNSCERCGEKCSDRTALTHHKADRHGVQLPDGTPEKSTANKRPNVKSFSVSDFKRRKFKLKKTTFETEPKADMESDGNRRFKNTSSQRQEDSSTGGKEENGTQITHHTKDTASFDAPAVVDAPNGSQSSPNPATTSHSTYRTIARATSTIALPTFQELRGIPPLPTIANQEPIQVVNLALPVGGGGIQDVDDLLDMGQQPAIFILSNDLDQNQYFDTLFTHQPTGLLRSVEETLTPHQLGHQLSNLQPTVAHEQVTDELNLLHQGQQQFSYLSNDSSYTSNNHVSHAFPGFP